MPQHHDEQLLAVPQYDKNGKKSSEEQVKGKKYSFKGECEKVKCARFVFTNRCGIKQSGSICSDSHGLTRNISRFLNSLNILLSQGWQIWQKAIVLLWLHSEFDSVLSKIAESARTHFELHESLEMWGSSMLIGFDSSYSSGLLGDDI